MPDNSIDYSRVPRFRLPYTYSKQRRDMGNCKTNQRSLRTFPVLVVSCIASSGQAAVVSLHGLADIKVPRWRDRVACDFPGELTACSPRKDGFITAKVTIWKDRYRHAAHKALGLLHKTIHGIQACRRRASLTIW